MDYLNQLVSNGASDDAVWAEFESTAQELDGCLCRRIPLTVARRFSAVLPAFRAFVPEATRYGVFNVLLRSAIALTNKPEGIALLIPGVALNTPMPEINDANTEDCLCRMLDEDASTRFVESVMLVRAQHPGATTYGVFLAMLSWSLAFAEKPANIKWLLHRGRKTAKGCKPAKHKTASGHEVRGV